MNNEQAQELVSLIERYKEILDKSDKTLDQAIAQCREATQALKIVTEKTQTVLKENDDLKAYLRTLANFGGTLDQARELAQKAVDKYQPTV